MARDARVFSARPGDIRKDGRGVARLGRCAASGGSAFDDASRRVFTEANMSGDEFGDDPGMGGEDSTDQVPPLLPPPPSSPRELEKQECERINAFRERLRKRILKEVSQTSKDFAILKAERLLKEKAEMKQRWAKH